MKQKPVKSKMSAGFELKDALRKYADGGSVEFASPIRALRTRNAQIDAAVDASMNNQDPNAAARAVRQGTPMPQGMPPVAAPPAQIPGRPIPPPAGGVPALQPLVDSVAKVRQFIGLRDGGRVGAAYARGGEVDGPGGPRDDMVPAMLSDGEYVLPAKTVQAMGGPEQIDDFVRRTNGREPGAKMVNGLRHAALGTYVDAAKDWASKTAQRVMGSPTTGNIVNAATEAAGKVAPAMEAAAAKVGPAVGAAQGAAERLDPGLRTAGMEVKPATMADFGRANDPMYDEVRARAAEARARTPTAMPSGGGATPPPPPTTGTGTAGSAAEAPKPSRIARIAESTGRGAARLTRGLGPAAFGGAVLSGFNDLEAYDPSTGKTIDDSASATFDRLREGDMKGLSQNLRAGLRRTGLEAMGGLAGGVDTVAGLFGAKPELQKTYYNAAQMSPVMGVGVRRRGTAEAEATSELARETNRGRVLRTPATASTPAAQQAQDPRAATRAALVDAGVDDPSRTPVPGNMRGQILREARPDPGVSVNLGNYGGNADVYGSASRPGGRIDNFVANGGPGVSSGYNLAANNASLARVNGMRQAMIDSQVPQGGGMSEGPTLYEQELRAREARMDRDAAVSRAASSGFMPAGARQALVADLNNRTQERGQDINAATSRRGQNLDYSLGTRRDDSTRRGQDLNFTGDRLRDQVAMRGQDLDMVRADATNRLAAARLRQEMGDKNYERTTNELKDFVGLNAKDGNTPENSARYSKLLRTVAITSRNNGIDFGQLDPGVRQEIYKLAERKENVDGENEQLINRLLETVGARRQSFKSDDAANYIPRSMREGAFGDSYYSLTGEQSGEQMQRNGLDSIGPNWRILRGEAPSLEGTIDIDTLQQMRREAIRNGAK